MLAILKKVYSTNLWLDMWKNGMQVKKLIGCVSETNGIGTTEIFDNQRDKIRTDTRSIVCFWSKEKLRTTKRELDWALFTISSAVSYMVKRSII
jgi:hypothetical protein